MGKKRNCPKATTCIYLMRTKNKCCGLVCHKSKTKTYLKMIQNPPFAGNGVRIRTFFKHSKKKKCFTTYPLA